MNGSAVPKTIDLTPSRIYHIPTGLLRKSDAELLVYAATRIVGQGRGGSFLTDAEQGSLGGISAATAARARGRLVRAGHITEHRRGRRTFRKAVHPAAYVAAHWYPVQTCLLGQPPGRARVLELRLFLTAQHKRAEHGEGAGCALTRDELAAELGVRPDRVSKAVAWLQQEGLLTVIQKPGRPWVLIPRFAHAVTRKIAPRALHAMQVQRTAAGVPRPRTEAGPLASISTAPQPPRTPPLPFAGLPPLSFGDPPPPQSRVFPQVTVSASRSPLNERVLNEPPAALWDVPGAVCQLAAPGQRPDESRPRGPKPPDLDWRDFRTRPAAIGVGA